MLAGAHKKFYRVQHAEIYLLDLKVQYKHKMKLSLTMISKHIFLYPCLPDYKYPSKDPDTLHFLVQKIFFVFIHVLELSIEAVSSGLHIS